MDAYNINDGMVKYTCFSSHLHLLNVVLVHDLLEPMLGLFISVLIIKLVHYRAKGT